MAQITVGGLASGIDSKGIIDELVSSRKQQLIDPIDQETALIKTKSTILSNIRNAFKDLQIAAAALQESSTSVFDTKKGESSDTSTLLVSSTSTTAITGTYVISRITSLAQADKVIFQGVANTSSTTFGTGSISITYKGDTTNITIDSSNNTLAGIRDAINDADAGVTASIINDGGATPYRLVLTSDDTGADSTITKDFTALSLVEDSTSSEAPNEPSDASFKVNNVQMTSATNLVTDAIPGVSFNILKKEVADTDTWNITVKQDTAAIVAKISTFIAKFNSLAASLGTIVNPTLQSTPNGNVITTGPLGHDAALMRGLSTMRSIISRSFATRGSDFSSLVKIGIASNSTGSSDLVVDTSELTEAINADVNNVKKIFQGNGSTEGIADGIKDLMDEYTTGGGVLFTKTNTLQSRSERLATLRATRARTLDNYKTQLQKQYANLEQVISGLQKNSNALSTLGNLASLNLPNAKK